MYGCKPEKDAKEMYVKTLAKSDHRNFRVARSGLVHGGPGTSVIWCITRWDQLL